MANTTDVYRLTATVRAERVRFAKDGVGRTTRITEEVEAQVEVTVNAHDLTWELGSAAIRNRNGKAGKMRGAIKAKILDEKILHSRTRTY